MQSDLLGAQSMGIRNLLIVTGDPPAIGDYPDATGGLRRRLDRPDQRGRAASIAGSTSAASRLASRPPSTSAWRRTPARSTSTQEVRRFRYKVEAGAEFAITQPVFEVDELARFLDRIADVRIPVLAGDHAAREPAACRVHGQRGAGRERAGGGARADARGRRGRPRAAEEGVAIAREVVAGIRPLVQGLQITTAGGAIDAAIEVLETVEA